MHPRTWTTRPRLALALVLLPLLALATACGDDGSDEDAREPTTQTTTDESDPGSTATTVGAEGPPEWVAVARDIAERNFELQADPEIGRIADLYSETCECWDEVRGTVEFLSDNNERIDGRPAEILFVRYEQTDEETGLVNLTVMGRTGTLRRVNADGDVVQEIPAEEPNCVAYAVLDDGPGGAYRIYSETSLPECPEEAA